MVEIADCVTVLRDGTYVAARPMTGVTQDEHIRMMAGWTVKELCHKQEVKPGPVVLRVTNLSRAGAFTGVSFELRQGEILGVAEPGGRRADGWQQGAHRAGHAAATRL